MEKGVVVHIKICECHSGHARDPITKFFSIHDKAAFFAVECMGD